jgi:hypothetical protein
VAYKLIRAIAGRRIAGSTWMPLPDGGHLRLTNASQEAAVRWFVERAAACIEETTKGDRRLSLLPLPGPDRVIGGPPSRARIIAQELAARTGLRVLDMLRWRQRMPRCRQSDTQFFVDNLVTSGAPARADCVLIADFVSSPEPLRAVSAILRQTGSHLALAVSAGRAADPPPADPFFTLVEAIEEIPEVRV